MKTMLAARYLGPHGIEAVKTPLPQIGPGEALIRVEACGFCGSDLGIVSGVHPRAKAPLTVKSAFECFESGDRVCKVLVAPNDSLPANSGSA